MARSEEAGGEGMNPTAQQGAEAPPFDLEPSDVPTGSIPERVIDELRHARSEAKDYAQAFGDAVKAQALKYGINAGALRRYVCALEADNLEAVDAETRDLEKLIGP